MQSFLVKKKIGGSLDVPPQVIAAGTIADTGIITYDYWVDTSRAEVLTVISAELRRYREIYVGQNYHVYNPVTRLTILTRPITGTYHDPLTAR